MTVLPSIDQNNRYINGGVIGSPTYVPQKHTVETYAAARRRAKRTRKQRAKQSKRK